MKRSDFRFLDRLRVRWAEVDMQKIVFNGHYLMYFDTAVAGYWRAMAMPYHETMHALAGDFYVRKATVEYLGSARYDDLCEVGIRCDRIGKSSMSIVCALFRGEKVLVHGELLYVFADPATQTSKAVPQELRDWFTAFEAGEPMVRVKVGHWGSLGGAARTIRRAVFTDEQGIAATLDEDGADAGALHALAINRLGEPLATGRVVLQPDGAAKIGRMAVIGSMRGTGIGGQVLHSLLNAAKSRGDPGALLHAQASAVPFYRRHGFVADGEPFDEAGIAHQAMVLRF
jgi:YbgC/YbaW family acyl-CoA thioester hydrolase